MAQSGFRLRSTSQKQLVKIARMRSFFASGIQGALTDIGKKNVKTARLLIKSTEKTGKVTFRRRNGRLVRHQASAAGEAPANFRGLLASSLAFQVSGFRFMKFGNTAPYSAFLELGTRNMFKRPYLIKAIEENEGYAFSRLAAGPSSKMGIK